MTLPDVSSRFRWEIVGGIGVFVLMLAVQFGAMVWYESDRNTALIDLSNRVAKLEEAHGHDADKLAAIGNQTSQIAGQLDQVRVQLNIITGALLAPASHVGRAP